MNLPAKIGGYRSRIINEIIDYLRSITILSSPGIKRHIRADGTVLEVTSSDIVPDEKLHFRIDLKSSTSIRIHGGKVNRLFGADRYSVALTVDAGDGATYAGYKDLSLTGTGFVVLTLNDEETPTALAVAIEATNPEPDINHCKFCLGKVTCVNSVISAIEQYRLGDISAPWNLTWLDSISVTPGYQKGVAAPGTALSLSASLSGTGTNTVTLNKAIPVIYVRDGRISMTDGSNTSDSVVVNNVAYATSAGSAGSAAYATSAGTVVSLIGHNHDELGGLADDDHAAYVRQGVGEGARNTAILELDNHVKLMDDTTAFWCGTHQGVSSTKKVHLLCDDGTYIDAYVRGGLLTAD